MKRWRTTLIVGGVFVALLVYVLVAEVGRERPSEPGVTPSPTPVGVLDISAEDVRAVTIADGARTVHLVREGEAWRIKGGGNGKPPDDGPAEAGDGEGAADATAVHLAVGDLAGLEARFPVDAPAEDRATYGLDPAAMTLFVETAEGDVARAHVVRVGRETPDGASFYVQRDGDPAVYVVEHYRLSRFFEWLLAPPYAPTPTPGGE